MSTSLDSKALTIEQLRQLLAMAQKGEIVCVEIARPAEEITSNGMFRRYRPGRKVYVTYTLKDTPPAQLEELVGDLADDATAHLKAMLKDGDEKIARGEL